VSGNVPLGAINALDRESLDLKSERAVANSPARGGELQGDQVIEQSVADYLIFRTIWVYSARGNNFMKTMLRLAKNKAELNIVAAQVAAPTTGDHLQ